MSEQPPRESYEFGGFRFQVADRSLAREGAPIRLTPKTAELLLVLLEAGGRVVTKDELIQRIWPSTFVEESNLPFQMHQARQALDDSAVKPRYIETVPRRGYRFICPIEGTDAQTISQAPTPLANAQPLDAVNEKERPVVASEPIVTTAAGRSNSSSRWTLVAVALIVVTAVAVLAASLVEPPPPRVARVTQLTHDGLDKGSLRILDASRLLFNSGRTQKVVRTDGSPATLDHRLHSYFLLDVSSVRGEALATRPNDAGAERGLWAVRLDGTDQRRLGMVQVTEVAVWSHDGQQIAYRNEHDLCITDAEGAVVRRIATLSGQVASIRWAPDDRSLRVSVWEQSDRESRMRQYDVAAEGGELRLLPSGNPMPVSCCGSWIPGSDDYVFEGASETARRIWLLRGRSGRFWRRPAALLDLTPAGPVNFQSPVASADGSRIFVLGSPGARLLVYDQTAAKLVPYLGGINAFAVHFSPDRQSLTYIKASDYTLWRARPDGSEPRQLTFAPWYVDGSAWSPDGHRLALRARAPTDAHIKIWLMSAEGGPLEPIDSRDVEHGSPSWSNDGAKLTFGDVPEAYGGPTGSEQIHIYDVAKKTTTNLEGSAGLWSSRWSPDGRYIAATRIADRAVMLYRVATGEWRELTTKGIDDVAWTQDSQYLYGDPEGQDRSARRIRVADGYVERILDLSPHSIAHTGAGLSVDGRPLFLLAAIDVYALELERR